MNRSLAFVRNVLALAAALGLSGPPSARAVDDDLLAHDLYRDGRYAEAAELFTDPAWKGVALYRAGQWWRAADAFVRADDALSAYNLGNAYARLGYPELALDAFRRALAADPSLDDARHNAEVMVKVLALAESGEGGGRSPSEDEIERVERERDADEKGTPDTGTGGEEEDERDQDGAGESEPGEEERSGGDETAPGDGGDAKDAEREARAGDGGGALGGEAGEERATNRASGESESGRERESAEAAGLRRQLESAQATEQWLARIAHDPERFLERRIALELRRRHAAGGAAPEGGSVW